MATATFRYRPQGSRNHMFALTFIQYNSGRSANGTVMSLVRHRVREKPDAEADTDPEEGTHAALLFRQA